MVGETATANGSSDGNLAATYALIYSFLSARSHEKAAAAVKKAVKDVVVLKDNITVDGASLDEIVRWWKAKEEADAKKKESDSDSDSDSSSEDSSSDDPSDSNTSSSSSSSSESSSESSNGPHDLGSQKAAKAANNNGKAVASPTVVSNHKKNSGTHSDKAPKKFDKSIPGKSGKATKSISSSSSSDSDSSDSGSSVAAPAKASQTATRLPKAGTTVVSTASNSTPVRATKKQRISESGNAIATTIIKEISPPPQLDAKVNGKKPRKSNTPFQRIKADAVEFHDERLKDNAFMARGASANDYGARANQDLIVTRGDGFRKEKNKKKRGSYRGGEITMESHSIKFT